MPTRGRPAKRPDERQGRHRTITSALAERNAEVDDLEAWEPPACPKRLDGEDLADEARDVWATYWRDPVARALGGANGIERAGVVTRWIRLVDEECRLVRRIAGDGDTVEGSQGQMRPHPLWGVLNAIREDIQRAETVLGLNPIDRARLGITAAVGALTVDSVNRELSRRAREDVDEDVVVLDDLTVPQLRRVGREEFGLTGLWQLRRDELIAAIERAAS